MPDTSVQKLCEAIRNKCNEAADYRTRWGHATRDVTVLRAKLASARCKIDGLKDTLQQMAAASHLCQCEGQCQLRNLAIGYLDQQRQTTRIATISSPFSR